VVGAALPGLVVVVHRAAVAEVARLAAVRLELVGAVELRLRLAYLNLGQQYWY
jgi:hypothetical protein